MRLHRHIGSNTHGRSWQAAAVLVIVDEGATVDMLIACDRSAGR